MIDKSGKEVKGSGSLSGIRHGRGRVGEWGEVWWRVELSAMLMRAVVVTRVNKCWAYGGDIFCRRILFSADISLVRQPFRRDHE